MVYLDQRINRLLFRKGEALVALYNLKAGAAKIISIHYPTDEEAVVTYLRTNGEYGVQHFKEA
jgi:hypothetical protein